MKNENTTLDLGADLPLGFCDQCVQRMAGGAFFERLVTPAGSAVLHAYCPHNHAGGTMILRTGWPRRWNLLQPIDVLDWQSVVALEAEGLKRLDPPVAEMEAAPVQTFGQRQELLQ